MGRPKKVTQQSEAPASESPLTEDPGLKAHEDMQEVMAAHNAEFANQLDTAPAETSIVTVDGTELTGVEAAPNPSRRDELGLVRGVTYHYLPDGKVDWRKMIDPKYIVLRKEMKDEIEKVTGKAYEEVSANELDDKYLLLLLGGIKDLLKLRGFVKVEYVNTVSSREYCSADCQILFTPNFETDFEYETFTDGADAHSDNVDGWYAAYLKTAANNRALVRCVRNYLGIYIVGKDEVGPGSKADQITNQTPTGVDGFGPHAMLSDLLKKRERTFEQLKKFLKEKSFEGDVDSWSSVTDIPKEKVFAIVGLIKKT